MALARVAFVAGLASIASVMSARTAHALGPIDVEVAAKGGVGAEYSGGQSPLGFGLGGRAGVVVPTRTILTIDHLYVGFNLMYSFGTNQGYQFVEGGPYTESIHTWMYGAEAGLGFKPIDNVTLRPQVGLGSASFGYSVTCPTTFVTSPGPAPQCSSSSWTSNNLYVEPGFTVLVALGTFFVGADVNLLVFPGLDKFDDAYGPFFITLHGQVGVKF